MLLVGCLLNWPVGVGGCCLVVIGWVGWCSLAWLVCGCWLVIDFVGGWLACILVVDSCFVFLK